MATAFAPSRPTDLPSWRDVVWPKEHGSWSLALEPVMLGLLVAPTVGGAMLSAAIVAGFFMRRPLRVGLVDQRPERRAAARRAVALLTALAIAAFVALAVHDGLSWWPWALPTAIAGMVFLKFDLQQAGREQQAELAGALAFAWLPAVFAALAGLPWSVAAAAGTVMCARAIPTVLTIRASVRRRKKGDAGAAAPVVAALTATAVTVLLARLALAPWTAAVATAVLATRTVLLLVAPRPVLRASTIGMTEAVLGVLFVAFVGLAWNR